MQVLKAGVAVEAGEVVDAACLSVSALDAYVEAELASAAAEGLMVSLHLKATMMKVSDPVLFGRVVSVFFKVRAGPGWGQGFRVKGLGFRI